MISTCLGGIPATVAILSPRGGGAHSAAGGRPAFTGNNKESDGPPREPSPPCQIRIWSLAAEGAARSILSMTTTWVRLYQKRRPSRQHREPCWACGVGFRRTG